MKPYIIQLVTQVNGIDIVAFQIRKHNDLNFDWLEGFQKGTSGGVFLRRPKVLSEKVTDRMVEKGKSFCFPYKKYHSKQKDRGD